MKEKLIIKNFGPIKDIELDLGRFNILIGEQATGKSTVAKVLAVCRYFSYIVGRKGLIREDNGIYYSIVAMDIPFIDGLEDWGLKDSLKPSTFIEYTCKHYKIIFDRDKIHDYGVVEIKPISKEFNSLLLQLKEINPDFYYKKDIRDVNNKSIATPIGNIPYNFYKNNVVNVMDNPFYIPTERGLQSIFSLGKSSVANMSDSMFNQLAKIDGIQRNFPNETNIEPLNIFYENRNGNGYIRKGNENQYYSLFNAASGYQSTIPIVLVVKYYTEKQRDKIPNDERGKTFLIEEPELNLFPEAQGKLMQYLVDKTMSFGNTVLLTTHSPYILTSLNNMMYAYQVGRMHPERVSKEIDTKYWLSPDDVSAYMMKSDGTAENIIDDEGLIKAEKIDEVSKAINKEFNNIMDIELGVDETIK